jgi:hypothetical protein
MAAARNAGLALARDVGTLTRLGADRGAVAFVWLVWAAMLLSLLVCIHLYGHNIPLAEDWSMVPALTGNEPDMRQWAWSQNNEHRLPLTRMIYLGLLRLSGDFRVGMVFNTLAVGGLASAMILLARKCRHSRTRHSDAVFPLVLLHIGHWNNLGWGWQIQFVVSFLLTCIPLMVVVSHGGRLSRTTAVAAGSCLVLLPLTGANGVLFGVGLTPWLAYEAWTHRQRRPDVAVILSVAVASVPVLVLLYTLGYIWGMNPASPSTAATLETSVKFIAMGLGPAVGRWWTLWALVAGSFLVAGAIPLLQAVLRSDLDRRGRPLGILLFQANMACLALAMGWGRAALVPKWGMPDRYALLAVPAFLATYFVWELYGPTLLRRFGPVALAATLAGLVPANTEKGFEFRDWYVRGMEAFERDVEAGVPRSTLAQTHYRFLLYWNVEDLRLYMQMLSRARIGTLPKIREDPGQLPAHK